MMRTKAIRIHSTGTPDVMCWEDIDVGEPQSGEVLLKQTAIGVNFIDTYHRSGLYPLPAMPGVLGSEGAGVVEQVGADVTHLQVGDRVAYAGGPVGAYAQWRCFPADRLVKIPSGIEDEQAAAVMLKGLTTHYLLRLCYPVQPGDTILVHAAAGGVGLLMCQWAHHLGATVIGTVSTQAKADLARAHGCAHPILYREEDFRTRVRELTGNRGLPVVYDSVGATTFEQSLDCLQPRGLMVTFGQSSGPVPPFAVHELTHRGSLFLTRPTLASYVATREELEANSAELFAVIQAGAVKIEVNQTYPLEQAAQAHRDLEARTTSGATVLSPGNDAGE